MLLSIIKNTQLLKVYDAIKTSFWFTPCLILLCTIACCTGLLLIDLYGHLEKVHWLHYLYFADANITRTLFITIASCVMTVVSITFSITMVALTNASSQFGPRLIRNFMEDTSTQMVLGVFISIFVYCLILVRMTDHFAGGAYLPGLTIAGATLMTLYGILLLIYFIHHVSLNLQTDSVIDNVFDELQSNINHIFQKQKDEEKTSNTKNASNAKKEASFELQSQECGYIQAINYACLTDLMHRLDGYLEVYVDPGEFVVARMVTMKCFVSELSDEDRQTIHHSVSLGSKRTPIQDPEFAIHQLVEIALRALSPGINDPYSAIACVDKLTATICNLTQVRFPTGKTYDTNSIERVRYKVTSFEKLANAAFDQIRQYSKTCLAVSLRQLEGLIRVAEQANNDTHWSFVRHQQQMLEHGLKQQSLIDLDKQEVNTRVRKLDTIFEKQRETGTE